MDWMLVQARKDFRLDERPGQQKWPTKPLKET
jgi:hypothetical protein